ncbi:LacI family transcriptional regulator [Actinomyces sp. 2119]|uniref:LacI family DNA-binding transcriptional regulator n=1 Tax=Actinomyces sp. 2119 TaxID=2321393 RepID=UPI000E6BCB01|nr:LacI family DNA-binding transcriptional regulator [Actinomyces sp. 2119]RJF43137.1 LacI family transcriptional regulator [Actinomyces sp. 2119]
MVATRADVARRAGVSPSTVTYVLTGERPTRRQTRERVMRAVRELGYQPNTAARSLASRVPRSVGVLFRMERAGIDLSDLDYVDGVRSRLESEGIQVSVPVLHRDSLLGSLRGLVRSQTLDAAVLMDVTVGDERERMLLDEEMPTVLIGTSRQEGGAPSVDADFEQMADLTVSHLAGLGHRRLVFLMRGDKTQKANAYQAQRRALRQAARRRGLFHLEVPVPENVAQGLRVLDNDTLVEGCTAVVSNNPEAMGGLVAAALARGLSIPEGFSLISLGATGFRDVQERLVSEVSVDRAAMGCAAGDLMVRVSAEPTFCEHTLMDGILYDHGSTAPPWPRRG